MFLPVWRLHGALHGYSFWFCSPETYLFSYICHFRLLEGLAYTMNMQDKDKADFRVGWRGGWKSSFIRILAHSLTKALEQWSLDRWVFDQSCVRVVWESWKELFCIVRCVTMWFIQLIEFDLIHLYSNKNCTQYVWHSTTKALREKKLRKKLCGQSSLHISSPSQRNVSNQKALVLLFTGIYFNRNDRVSGHKREVAW